MAESKKKPAKSVPLDWLETSKVVGADAPVDAVDVFDPANESPGWLADPQVTIGQDAGLTGVLRARGSRALLAPADPLARKIKQKAASEPAPAPFVPSSKRERTQTQTRRPKAVRDIDPKYNALVRRAAREAGSGHVEKFCAWLKDLDVPTPKKYLPVKDWLEAYAHRELHNSIRGIKKRFSQPA
jgi:hypothetical protein